MFERYLQGTAFHIEVVSAGAATARADVARQRVLRSLHQIEALPLIDVEAEKAAIGARLDVSPGQARRI